MIKMRFSYLLLIIFIIAVGCQKKQPQLSPFQDEEESDEVILPTPKENELTKGFETKEEINEVGQIKVQSIIETGGREIPKDLSDKNIIKKKTKPGLVENIHIDSWILFLIPDDTFLKKVNLIDIKEAFGKFGKSIRDQHIAVWVSNEKGNPDIDKMRYYCHEKFGLDFNHGPYIVITETHPDVRTRNDRFFRIKLYAINGEWICWLLNNMAFSIDENKIKTIDLFVDEKIALLKSHIREMLRISESLLDSIIGIAKT